MVISNRAVTCSVPALLLPLLFYVRSHQKALLPKPVFMQSAHTVFAVSWETLLSQGDPSCLAALPALPSRRENCVLCLLFVLLTRDAARWLHCATTVLVAGISLSLCQHLQPMPVPLPLLCSALLLASQCHAAAFFIMLWLFYALRFLRQWQLT